MNEKNKEMRKKRLKEYEKDIKKGMEIINDFLAGDKDFEIAVFPGADKRKLHYVESILDNAIDKIFLGDDVCMFYRQPDIYVVVIDDALCLVSRD